ncbi:MAG: RHS repeat-associated core domain-containing protein, partial [Leptothrix ochracea]
MASVNTAGVTKSGPLGTFFYAYDETGLFHNGHRDYNPATGRYIQPDPIGLEGGINRYGYVGGNPVSFVDPLGLERFLGEDKAVDFLRQNKCNTQKAWEHLQMYRKSYPGL